MGNSKSQIKLGAILSYINIGIGNLIPVFYTPLMLQLLGQSEYGLYKMASSTTSYLSLMALGIGSAITRYLIKAQVDGGKEEEEKTFGLFHLIFQIIAILTCIVGMIIVFNLDVLYGESLTVDELNRMKIIVFIMVLNMAIGFSATAYNSIAVTHERFVFIQTANIGSTIVLPIVNIIILYLGYGSIGMVVSSLVINILIRIVYIYFIRQRLNIRPKYKNMPTNLLGEIVKFSFWVLVGQLAGQLYNATDTVIIGMIPSLATVGVAVYNIGVIFSDILFSLSQVTPTLFMPTVNKMVFSDVSNEEVSNLVIKVGRIQAYLITLIAFGFVAFGQPFIEWYVGAEYEQSYWIAIFVMIPNCIPLIQSVALSTMQAKNMHKFRSILYLVVAVINVVATLSLVKCWGIIGAAIATGIAFLIGHGIILNVYYWKKVKIDIPRFWKDVSPIFVNAIVLTVITLCLYKWIDFYNATVMFGGILIYAILYCLMQWKFVMNAEEKNMFCALLRKLVKK